nr:hypothetical protein CFP56_54421 [Quercus suber]
MYTRHSEALQHHWRQDLIELTAARDSRAALERQASHLYTSVMSICELVVLGKTRSLPAFRGELDKHDAESLMRFVDRTGLKRNVSDRHGTYAASLILAYNH